MASQFAARAAAGLGPLVASASYAAYSSGNDDDARACPEEEAAGPGSRSAPGTPRAADRAAPARRRVFEPQPRAPPRAVPASRSDAADSDASWDLLPAETDDADLSAAPTPPRGDEKKKEAEASPDPDASSGMTLGSPATPRSSPPSPASPSPSSGNPSSGTLLEWDGASDVGSSVGSASRAAAVSSAGATAAMRRLERAMAHPIHRRVLRLSSDDSAASSDSAAGYRSSSEEEDDDDDDLFVESTSSLRFADLEGALVRVAVAADDPNATRRGVEKLLRRLEASRNIARSRRRRRGVRRGIREAREAARAMEAAEAMEAEEERRGGGDEERNVPGDEDRNVGRRRRERRKDGASSASSEASEASASSPPSVSSPSRARRRAASRPAPPSRSGRGRGAANDDTDLPWAGVGVFAVVAAGVALASLLVFAAPSSGAGRGVSRAAGYALGGAAVARAARREDRAEFWG